MQETTLMETVDSFLLSFIFKEFPRGSVFFAEDLERSGLSPDVIRWSLTRIVTIESGVIRLSRGVYCYPERAGNSGKLLVPSPEIIAQHLARRWRLRIAPYGANAAYLAGFTGLQVDRFTWASDGSDQVFHLQNGITITFKKRKSQKIFQYRSSRMRNLVEAMRFLGKEYTTHTKRRGVIADNLQLVRDEEFLHDVRLAPLWIRETLKEIRD